MQAILEISCNDGGYTIFAEELDLLTDKQLRKLHISRAELKRCFAEGVALMRERGITERDRVRPCADETLNGEWVVNLVKYSPLADPLMRAHPLMQAHRTRN